MILIYIGDSRNVINRIRSNHCSGNVEGSRLRQCIAKRMGYGFEITKRQSGTKRIRIAPPNPPDGESKVSSYIRSGKWKYVICKSYDEAHDFQWYAIDKLNTMLNAICKPWKQIKRNRYQKLLEKIEKSPEYSCEKLKKLKTGPGVYVFYHEREPQFAISQDGNENTRLGRNKMPFPSKALRDWCRNIQKLVANTNLNTGFTNYNDGFCLCDMDKVINLAPVDQHTQLASGIFWSVWIDQVLYYVLVDGGVEGLEPDTGLYEKFRNTYTFPKLREHCIPAHASPSFLLDGNRKYYVPDSCLLLEDKQEFWGDVSCWLDNIKRADVRDAAEKAFKEDLDVRFPEGFDYLFA